jgi:hypothetical protein
MSATEAGSAHASDATDGKVDVKLEIQVLPVSDVDRAKQLHTDVAETIAQRETPLAMPVLAMGAEGTLGTMVRDQLVKYARDVTGDVAPTGHWVAEEDPAYLTPRLLAFLSGDHVTPRVDGGVQMGFNRRLRTLLIALTVAAAACATLLAGAASASGETAPVGVLSAEPAETGEASEQLTSPPLPAGAFINRPTVPLSTYRAIKAAGPGASARRSAASVPAAPYTVTSSFGFNGIGQAQACGRCSPSDSNGAVSPTQIAETTNSHLTTYSKTGSQISDKTFASLTKYTKRSLFDPRIVYDATWKRFLLSVEADPESSSVQYQFILASKGSKASGGWWVYKLNVASQCGASFPFWDYPQLGQTQDAAVVTANCFENSTYKGPRVFGVAKSLLYNGLGFSVPFFAPSSSDGTATPANVYDPRPANVLITTAQHLVYFQDPQAAFYASLKSDTAITGYEKFALPRAAGQAGCTTTSCKLDTSDGRFVNDSSQFGDQLWNVTTYGQGGVNGSFATPYWGQFSISGSSTTQFGSAVADNCSDDFNASLVASTESKVWLNWTSTDPQGSACGQTFARQYEAGRTSATAAGKLDNLTNPFTSEAELTGNFDPNFGLQRWGDTSSLSLDGLSTAWSVNNSVPSSSEWGTRWQELTQ